MANQIGLVNAINELCDNETTAFQNDSFIPVFRKNGSENIVEKMLGKNLPSEGSVNAKNVIVINSDVAEVEGKVYNSFDHAKSYMESNPYESFCVELPAGEFDEEITLDMQYTIHGNNTILTQPIYTNITITTEGFENHTPLSDCIVKNYGFVNVASNSESYSYFSAYNCLIEEIGSSETFAVISLFNCNLNVKETTNTYENFSIAAFNSTISYFKNVYNFNGYNCLINYFKAATSTEEKYSINGINFSNCSFTNSNNNSSVDTANNTVFYKNCSFERFTVISNSNNVTFSNCSGNYMTFNPAENTVINIYCCSFSISGDSPNGTWLTISSDIIFDNSSDNIYINHIICSKCTTKPLITPMTNTVTIGTVWSDSTSIIMSGTNDVRYRQILYSVDGATYTSDSTNATKYAILKNTSVFPMDGNIWVTDSFYLKGLDMPSNS